MRSLKHIGFRFLIFSVVSLFCFLTSCKKNCQAPAQQNFQTFTDQEWRLTDSNNPEVSQNLNNVNFLIFSFGRNFRGEVFSVQRNERIDQAVLTFEYDVDIDRQLIRASFFAPQVDESGQIVGQEPAGDIEYSYELDTELVLTETDTGYTYRYVPFTGVVDPDNNCSF